jgi:cytochrome c-type biogenesis protein CcmH/NrfG
MGFILIQAGHADAALLAFDKALTLAPNLAMALWGKGITLYQSKQDYAGAKEAFEKLLQIMPPGPERAEVEKTLAENASGTTQTTRFLFFNKTTDQRENLRGSKTQSQRGLSSDSLHHRAACQRC